MSQFRHLYRPFRQLSTSRIVHRPILSSDYKSRDLWEERLNCNLLASDQDIIKTINSKIMSDIDLNNLELDVFINIATPREDVAQLCEAVKALQKFRKSLAAHTLLPSTSHAVCRLFLESNLLPSLVRLLEKRIEFGVFPDAFIMNIMFDRALEEENLSLASRLAALIMLQEEFGAHNLNDSFALYSVSKYVESKTDFQDWITAIQIPDSILEPEKHEQYKLEQQSEQAADADQAKEDEEDEEGEEDDAEYIRIPFLRNPYNDKHFDLTNPREICGKTLSQLGQHLTSNQAQQLGSQCKLLGDILSANWLIVKDDLSRCLQSKVPLSDDAKEVVLHYMENLHDLTAPDAKLKESILKSLDKLPKGKTSISQEAESRHEHLQSVQQDDIQRFREDIERWTQLREATKQDKDAFEEKQRLIAEIRAKKDELRAREQYLYFYDDLKKRNLTKLEYD